MVGEIVATLPYMNAESAGGETYLILMSDLFYDELSFPAYYMELYLSAVEGASSAQFIAMESEDQYSVYYHTDPAAGISFDAATHTLTIMPIDFIKLDMQTGEFDSSKTITLNGMLAKEGTSIPANVPTQISLGEALYADDMDFTIDLMADGTITLISSYGESEPDSGFGTWQVDDETLMIYETYEDDDGTYIDTVAATFEVDAGILTLHLEIDMCDEGDCEDMEETFAFEPGSLVATIQVLTYEFSQTAPAAKGVAGPPLLRTSLTKEFQTRQKLTNPFRN